MFYHAEHFESFPMMWHFIQLSTDQKVTLNIIELRWQSVRKKKKEIAGDWILVCDFMHDQGSNPCLLLFLVLTCNLIFWLKLGQVCMHLYTRHASFLCIFDLKHTNSIKYAKESWVCRMFTLSNTYWVCW